MKVNTNISKLVRMLWLIMLSLAMLKCQSDSKTPQQAIIEANVLDDDTGSSSLCIDPIKIGKNTFNTETNGLEKAKGREKRVIPWDSIEVLPDDGSPIESFSYPTTSREARKEITAEQVERGNFNKFTQCITYFRNSENLVSIEKNLREFRMSYRDKEIKIKAKLAEARLLKATNKKGDLKALREKKQLERANGRTKARIIDLLKIKKILELRLKQLQRLINE